MKRFVFVVSIFLLCASSRAQMVSPVKWTYSSKKLSDKTHVLHITATLDSNWHIYAQEAGEGPEPTKVTFVPNPLIEFDGEVKEVGRMEKSFDENFNSTLKYYSNKVDFVQKIKTKSTIATVVKGSVVYMVCNDRKCLPPKEVPFSIKIGGK